MREEPCQRVLLDRLDFAAQLGQRLAPDLPQNLRVAPLAMEAAGAKTAFENATLHRELVQGTFHYSGIEGETISHLAKREWTVRASVTANKFQHRLRHRIHERGGQPGRKRNSKRIAIARGILHRNQTSLAGNAQFEQSARTQQPIKRFEHGWVDHTPSQFGARQIAQSQQQIVNPVSGTRPIRLNQALRRLFHFGNSVGIEQLAQIGLAEQFAQLVLVDR